MFAKFWFVIPAKAGICSTAGVLRQIPAFAGMTGKNMDFYNFTATAPTNRQLHRQQTNSPFLFSRMNSTLLLGGLCGVSREVQASEVEHKKEQSGNGLFCYAYGILGISLIVELLTKRAVYLFKKYTMPDYNYLII
jgi:hypothetical protein